MTSTPFFYLSLVCMICLVTSCNSIHSTEHSPDALYEDAPIDTTSITIPFDKLMVELEYVSRNSRNINTYHNDKVLLPTNDRYNNGNRYNNGTVIINDGIQNYAWTDTCNSFKIALITEPFRSNNFNPVAQARYANSSQRVYNRYQFHVDFGDGTQSPPSTNPRVSSFIDNDIVHLYKEAGVYQAHILLQDRITKKQQRIPFTMNVQESPICARPTQEEIYIVRLTEDSTNEDMEEVSKILDVLGARKIYTYTEIFKGFAIEYNATAIETIATHENVEQYSIDQPVEDSDQDIEEREWEKSEYRLPLDNFVPAIPLSNDAKAHIYIVDTATYQHNDFKERIREGINFVTDNGEGLAYFGDSQAQEGCHNHATHVTGIAAGRRYGIAKYALIHPVQVLDCYGTGSVARVLAGLDWITANAQRPAVVNMSIGAQPSRHLDDAVLNSSRKEIFYAVSAGNNNSGMEDSCQQSPARIGKDSSIMTVGASTHKKQVASISLQGPCLDIFALGENVISAGINGPNDIAMLSGSSMATPHIAGAAALYLEQHPYATTQEVHKHIISEALPNYLTNVKANTINLLYPKVGETIFTGQVSQVVITPTE